MTWDGSKIPVWLRRTPEQQVQDAALQEHLKQAYGLVHLSPTEKHLMRAQMIERSAQSHLDHLLTVSDAPEHHLNSAKAQLAEAWADQGKFREAAELHPFPEYSNHFLKFAEAVEMDDAADCGNGCQAEHVQHPVTGKSITIDSENVDAIVFSLKHNTLMPLVRCKCGFLNVKHAPVSLQHRIENIKKE